MEEHSVSASVARHSRVLRQSTPQLPHHHSGTRHCDATACALHALAAAARPTASAHSSHTHATRSLDRASPGRRTRWPHSTTGAIEPPPRAMWAAPRQRAHVRHVPGSACLHPRCRVTAPCPRPARPHRRQTWWQPRRTMPNRVCPRERELRGCVQQVTRTPTDKRWDGGTA